LYTGKQDADHILIIINVFNGTVSSYSAADVMVQNLSIAPKVGAIAATSWSNTTSAANTEL